MDLAADSIAAIEQLLPDLRDSVQRILLIGESGAGKSTLAGQLTNYLESSGRETCCLSCDPGLPAFGLPGCVSLARRVENRWNIVAQEALCSLDAGRFRLPLVSAVQKLLPVGGNGNLIIDTPGLVQGAAAGELLIALADSAEVTLTLLLRPAAQPPPLANYLHTLPGKVQQLDIEPAARPLSRSVRHRERSRRWQSWLKDSIAMKLDTDSVALVGAPPPLSAADAWKGRQVALYSHGKLQTMGEVIEVSGSLLSIRVATAVKDCDRLLARDAVHRDGILRTAPKRRAAATAEIPGDGMAREVRVELGALTSTADEPQVSVRIGKVTATLVNGVMGDPLLQIRLLHENRSLLFDIGDSGRMPLRGAHQISDLFVSHTHADHIGGFLWLVRCRIGEFPACRIFGPPGLARQVLGMVNGILWDRVENRAPRFLVHEWSGDHLQRHEVIAGHSELQELPAQPIDEGLLLQEPGFTVRAVQLDHGTPVLAFAFETLQRLNVRAERLQAQGLHPGPWLQDLKAAYLQRDWQQMIDTGNGQQLSVADLADRLLLRQPGDKIVYATDFAASAANINRLSELARNAHTLFCEASFLEEDSAQAQRTQHLTTTACARIAELARVRQLIAFHFSHRYEKQRQRVYRELQKHTSRVLVPLPGT